MGTATFKKEDLRSLVGGEDCDGLEVVSDTLIDVGRWSLHYALVLKEKATGKFYATNYQRGATESQDEAPFEYDADLIKCTEVRPVEKVVIVYERVP